MVIIGNCEEMCPPSEVKMSLITVVSPSDFLKKTRFRRYKEGLLHVLEIKQGSEFSKRPLPDRERMVKAFSRSAAGRQVAPKDLRTPEALQRTVNYLLYEVASSQIIPWCKTYDFIADRLLAVRQDMVIQEIPRCYAISLLQPIVRFYAYSSYRLCDRSTSEFDPVINKKNLQECLKRLLVLYDEFDVIVRNVDNLKFIEYNKDDFEVLFRDCREFFEALYILFNLGDAECIYRGFKLENRWRTELVENALKISLCYKKGNWIRTCRMMAKLPSILAAVTSLHLPALRRATLEKMSVAYSSKNLSYPTEELRESLLYADVNELIRDCVEYNVKCSEKEIKFLKSDFDIVSRLVPPRKEKFVAEKFGGISPSTTLDLRTF